MKPLIMVSYWKGGTLPLKCNSVEPQGNFSRFYFWKLPKLCRFKEFDFHSQMAISRPNSGRFWWLVWLIVFHQIWLNFKQIMWRQWEFCWSMGPMQMHTMKRINHQFWKRLWAVCLKMITVKMKANLKIDNMFNSSSSLQ